MKKIIMIALSALCICSCAKKNEAPETYVGMSMDTHIIVQVNDSTGKDILDSLALKSSDFKAYADAAMETDSDRSSRNHALGVCDWLHCKSGAWLECLGL